MFQKFDIKHNLFTGDKMLLTFVIKVFSDDF